MPGIARLFTQTVSVRTYLGRDASGPVLGAAASKSVFVAAAEQLDLAATGAQVVSGTTLYAAIGDFDAFAPGSLVHVNGRDSEVQHVYRRDSAGPSSVHHIQITLK